MAIHAVGGRLGLLHQPNIANGVNPFKLIYSLTLGSKT